MRRSDGIHWFVPTSILSCLVFGIICALSHHLFYQSLQGTSAQNDAIAILGSSVSQQQLNVAVGTAFAFLANAALAGAVSTAYIQLFWFALRQAAQPKTLETLDTMFAALSNALSMCMLQIWWRYPLMFSIAMIAWLLPVASIVPPATLSVINAPLASPVSRLTRVPNVDFISLNYVAAMTPYEIQPGDNYSNESTAYYYKGPSRAISVIAQEVLTTGSILPIQPVSPNSSWTVEFAGPALQCGNVSNEAKLSILWNIINATMDYEVACQPAGYVAWTGSAMNNGSVPLPYQKLSRANITTAFKPAVSGSPNSTGFYIASLPQMMDVLLQGDDAPTPSCGSSEPSTLASGLMDTASVIHCQMINATYRPAFHYVNGVQDVDIRAMDSIPRSHPIPRVLSVMGPAPAPSQAKFQSSACSVLNRIGNVCVFDRNLLSSLSYQAILDAFSGVLLGSVYKVEDNTSPTFNTSIDGTKLINTPELEFLTQTIVEASFATSTNLQDAINSSNGTLFRGPVNNIDTTSAEHLSSLVENLFSKAVISMMSSELLQPNTSSHFAPPPTNVTIHEYQNIYTYSAAKLWLAYGPAIFFASCAAVIGLITLLANGTCFSNNFSAVLLVGRNVRLSKAPQDNDMKGADPLPTYLRKVTVSIAPIAGAVGKKSSPEPRSPSTLT